MEAPSRYCPNPDSHNRNTQIQQNRVSSEFSGQIDKQGCFENISQVGDNIIADLENSFVQPQFSLAPHLVQSQQPIGSASETKIENVVQKLASVRDTEEFWKIWAHYYHIYSRDRLFDYAEQLKKYLINYFTNKFEELNSCLSTEFSLIEIGEELGKLISAFNQADQFKECADLNVEIFKIPLKPALIAAWYERIGKTDLMLMTCHSAYQNGNRDIYVGNKIIHDLISHKNREKALEVIFELKKKLTESYQGILLKLSSDKTTEVDLIRADQILASRSSLILMQAEIHLDQGRREDARKTLLFILSTRKPSTLNRKFNLAKFNNLAIEAGLFADGEVLAKQSVTNSGATTPLEEKMTQCWCELCEFLSNPSEEKGNHLLSTFHAYQESYLSLSQEEKKNYADALELAAKERPFLIEFILNCLKQYIAACQSHDSIHDPSVSIRQSTLFRALLKHFKDHKIYTSSG